MTRLLLVEDDALIGEMIRLNLQQQGYDVTWLRDGAGAEPVLLGERFDMAVLDVNLPGITGFDLARRARDAGLGLPILMLTARSDTASKVIGLDAGADDYLTKPFDVAELMARVRALLRRAGAETDVEPAATVKLGPLQVNLSTGEAETLAGPQTLDPAELCLLSALVRHRGQDLPLPELLEDLASAGASGQGADPSTVGLQSADQVRATVERLRAKFEPDTDRPRHFLPIAGGYRFEG